MPDAILDELIAAYPVLKQVKSDVFAAYQVLEECFQRDHTLFTCGNGGSAADADHIVGELLKAFVLPRPLPVSEKRFLKKSGWINSLDLMKKLQCGLKAVNLMSQTAIFSAAENDLGADMGIAQTLCGLGRKGDCLLAISTSGNAKNIYLACQVAKARKIKIIGLTGKTGGLLKSMADVCIVIPSNETYKIQELHLPVYHALCRMVEKRFFGAEASE